MTEKDIFLSDISRLHTTELGAVRIMKNLGITEEPVLFCKGIILRDDCNIFRQGKNWYCETDDIIITINAHSFTIITAHKTRRT